MKSKGCIVFLAPGFPKNEEDTTCIPALQLYVKNFNLVNPFLKIIIIAFQYPYIRKEYNWNRIKIYSAGGKGRGSVFRLITWIYVIRYFIKIRRKEKIKGIHSFWLSECAIIGQLLSKLFNLPHVASLMGQDAKRSNKYLRYLNFSKLTVTSGSQFASSIFSEVANSKISLNIPFGIENKNGALITNKNRDIDIIGVGSFIPLKNYKLFVNIISELKKDIPFIKSLLIGDGEERSEIEKMIAVKNLSENILLTGKIPRNDVLNYMKQSKIFLHTSLYESQGLVFLEALYCGLSVVSFNVGYLPGSKKAFICNNEAEMINTIKKLLSYENEYEQEIHITIEDTAKEFNAIYSKLGIT